MRKSVNWAILNGEKEFGVTVHYVSEEIDAGDIIYQRTYPIGLEDDYSSIIEKAYQFCAEGVMEAVRLISENAVEPRRMDLSIGTYFPTRQSGDEWIDWNDTTMNVYNFIRAITRPGPGAHTICRGKKVIIWKAKLDERAPFYRSIPGAVVDVIEGIGCKVKTADSHILITQAQWNDDEEVFIPNFKLGTRLGFDWPKAYCKIIGIQ